MWWLFVPRNWSGSQIEDIFSEYVRPADTECRSSAAISGVEEDPYSSRHAMRLVLRELISSSGRILGSTIYPTMGKDETETRWPDNVSPKCCVCTTVAFSVIVGSLKRGQDVAVDLAQRRSLGGEVGAKPIILEKSRPVSGKVPSCDLLFSNHRIHGH